MTTPLDLSQAINANLPLAPGTNDPSGYGKIFQSFFGGLPPAEQQQIWDAYLSDGAAQYLTGNSSQTGVVQINSTSSGFVYQGLVDLSGLEGTTLTSAQIAAFQAAASSIAALNANVAYGFNEKLNSLDLHTVEGYLTTANPSLASYIPTIAQNLVELNTQGFLNYVGAVFSENNIDLALSPNEVKQRMIMQQTFDSLISMLLDLQNNVQTEGGALTFYGNYQEEYTNALAQVPTYVGGTVSTPTLGNLATATSEGKVDWSKVTFGYDNISMQEIAQNLVQQLSSGSATVILKDQPFVTGMNDHDPTYFQTSFGFNAVQSGSSMVLNISIKTAIIGSTGGVVTDYSPTSFNWSVSTGITGPQNTTQAIATAKSNALLSSFYTWYKDQLPNASTEAQTAPVNDASTYPAYQLLTPNNGELQLYAGYVTSGGQAWALQNTSKHSGDYIYTPSIDNQANSTGSFRSTGDYWGGTEIDNLPQLNLTTLLITPQTTGVNTNGFGGTLHYNVGSGYASGNYTRNDSSDILPIPSDTSEAQVTGLGQAWLYTYLSNPGTNSSGFPGNIGSADSKSRAEINSRDQQYIENLRSYRQNIQNIQTQEQSDLSDTEETITEQTDLISSIIDSLKGIISSIFR